MSRDFQRHRVPAFAGTTAFGYVANCRLTTRADPFEHTWPTVEQWLQSEPGVSTKDLMHRLAAMMPDVYSTTAQLRTLQRRVKAWRSEQAKQLIFGTLRPAELHANANGSAH